MHDRRLVELPHWVWIFSINPCGKSVCARAAEGGSNVKLATHERRNPRSTCVWEIFLRRC